MITRLVCEDRISFIRFAGTKSNSPPMRPDFCEDAFRLGDARLAEGGVFLVEDAPRAERADAPRLAGARLLVLLVERAAVRFAFFALAMCDRPLLLEG